QMDRQVPGMVREIVLLDMGDDLAVVVLREHVGHDMLQVQALSEDQRGQARPVPYLNRCSESSEQLGMLRAFGQLPGARSRVRNRPSGRRSRRPDGRAE